MFFSKDSENLTASPSQLLLLFRLRLVPRWSSAERDSVNCPQWQHPHTHTRRPLVVWWSVLSNKGRTEGSISVSRLLVTLQSDQNILTPPCTATLVYLFKLQQILHLEIHYGEFIFTRLYLLLSHKIEQIEQQSHLGYKQKRLVKVYIDDGSSRSLGNVCTDVPRHKASRYKILAVLPFRG